MTALVNAASLARTTPAVYVIEDAHWIDEVSESMLADFLAVIPQTPSMVLITYRPEYRGALARVAASHTIALAPLHDSQTSTLCAELLGSDPSVAALAAQITERAAGNPFFTEEMVRDLVERGVLGGDRGVYVSRTDVADVSVPATLQATIAARIDRLGATVKRTLNAAAVIGSRFGTDLLTSLGIEPAFDELVHAELIDQVKFTPHAEYAFRHPLIRTVAYESQLKSDRAELHRRLATAIQQRDPGSVEENAALIAGHLESAGDLHGAYSWHMRAGAWSTNRDLAAARMSWQRACKVADRLPEEDPDRTSMRIAPRALLCASAWRLGGSVADTGFDELRGLCTVAGDQRSLAIGMTGLVMALTTHNRLREASRLASEHVRLLESVGDSTLMVGLSVAAIVAKHEAGEMAEMLRIAQGVIDLAAGDPAKGNLIIGSPLATALAWRGEARWCLGLPGWKDDFDRAVAMGSAVDPMSHAIVVVYRYVVAIPTGALLPDATALRDTAEALEIAERSADDIALALAQGARGIALVHHDGPERESGFALLATMRETALKERFTMTAVPIVDIHFARERARLGDLDGAIELARTVVDDLFASGGVTWSVPATTVLVESLLHRGADGDLQEAQAAIDRLAAVPTDAGFVLRDITLLRLRALLARAHGDKAAYREFVNRYRAMATSLGFEGHIAWAEAMT